MLTLTPAPTITPLDERLSAVASLVRGAVVADIGTDHALLPKHLLESGQVQRAIAVEKNEAPADNARESLRGLNAEVRLGDGFEVLQPGEVDCATLCGLGGWLIAGVLSRFPDRLPPRLVLQANRDTPLLRVWALERGYHLESELMAAGLNFVVLSLVKGDGPDPAYDGIPRELAIEFGPHLLRDRHPLLKREIDEREQYFRDTRALGVHRLLCQARDYFNG